MVGWWRRWSAEWSTTPCSASEHGPDWSSARACSMSSGRPPTCPSCSCSAAPGTARPRWCRSGCATTTARSPGSRSPRQHDDPAVLLADIVRVLDEFEPLEPRAKQRLVATSTDFSSVLVPRVERAVAERARPFVLVLDDAHRLRQRAVWSLVQALADRVPAGSQLVLVSRHDPELALGRMRADRRVHTVSGRALAMDPAETQALVEASGLSLPSSVVDQLRDSHRGVAGRPLPRDPRARRCRRPGRRRGRVRG